MRKSIYEINYQRLQKLGIVGTDIELEHRISKSEGYMDLVVERIGHKDNATGNKGVAISLAHYFKQNGDLCADPDMEIVVYHNIQAVEALTFSQSIPPIYQEVYPEAGKFYPRLKKQHNSFLRTWLNNLIDQGHGNNWVVS